MKINITKANGNNNDFIIILKKDLPNKFSLTKDFIKSLCKQELDNLVDGFILIDSDTYKVDYYNNDGTWETLCINSLRCSALLLNQIENKRKFNFLCGDGEHLVTVNSANSITASMLKPRYKSKEILVEGCRGYFIDSGAKHFVIEYKESWPNIEELTNISQKIRYNSKIFPEGINVNFFKKINNDSIHVKTYEKGIESIMPSCASGSFACAYHYAKKSLLNTINVKNDVGSLITNFDFKIDNYSITGPAEIEYQKEINI